MSGGETQAIIVSVRWAKWTWREFTDLDGAEEYWRSLSPLCSSIFFAKNKSSWYTLNEYGTTRAKADIQEYFATRIRNSSAPLSLKDRKRFLLASKCPHQDARLGWYMSNDNLLSDYGRLSRRVTALVFELQIEKKCWVETKSYGLSASKDALREQVHAALKTFDKLNDVYKAETSRAMKCLLFGSSILNGIPIVGHVKGAVHYAIGDVEGARQAEKQATRTVAVVAAGGAGVAAGPGGAMAAAAAAGTAFDAATTAIKSHREGKYAPDGNLVNVKEVLDAKTGREKAKAVAYLALGVGSDAVTGLIAGKTKLRARELGEVPLRKDGITPDRRFNATKEAFKGGKMPNINKAKAANIKKGAIGQILTKIGDSANKVAITLLMTSFITAHAVATSWKNELKRVDSTEGENPEDQPRMWKIAANAAAAAYEDVKRDLTEHLVCVKKTKTYTVWANSKMKRAIISFRGTVPTDWNDLVHDFYIAVNSEHACARFQGREVFNWIKEKYANYERVHFKAVAFNNGTSNEWHPSFHLGCIRKEQALFSTRARRCNIGIGY
eukprot:jgi/Bigna1/89087/estExt_fgenesh1_pg.C_430083